MSLGVGVVAESPRKESLGPPERDFGGREELLSPRLRFPGPGGWSSGSEDLLPRTYGRYANFTFVQTTSAPSAIRLRGGADFAFVNGVVKTPAGQTCVNMIASNQVNGAAATGNDRSTIRPANSALQDVGPPTFNSVYFQCQGR